MRHKIVFPKHGIIMIQDDVYLGNQTFGNQFH